MKTPIAGSLEGTIVVDASRILAGPFAGQVLGDHGAKVTKIEAFEGDDTRRFGPPFLDGSAPYFFGLNRNKKNLALDLSSEEGRELLFEMLEKADVFIENFKASTWKKWGIDDLSEITRRFPRLVHCRVSGFGETGEFGGMPGYDAALQAISGLMAINGPPEGAGSRIGIPVVDICTGLNSCLGILLALLERNRSGRGQMIEAALFDTAIAILHPHASNVLHGGGAKRTGNGHPNIVPYDLYPTGTVPLFLAVGNDRQFRRLCKELGDESLAQDPQFIGNGDRVAHREEMRARLIPLLAPFDGMALFKQLMAAGVPCAPVLTVEETLALDHTKTREMTVELDGYKGPGIAIKMGRTPGAVLAPPSDIGQHSKEVLQEFGISKSRIESLEAAQIIR